MERERAQMGFQDALTISLDQRACWMSGWWVALAPEVVSRFVNEAAAAWWDDGAVEG